MAENSKIQWTDHTLNGWWGCVEVGPGCDNCYARELAKRFGRKVWGVHAPRFFTKDGFRKAYAWQKKAEHDGVKRRVFVQSMSDIFEVLDPGHPSSVEMAKRRFELFDEIIPACPSLIFQLLTKRIGNAGRLVPWVGKWPANVWMGISVVNQAEADRDVLRLMHLQGPRTRFVSYEPALGPLTMTNLAKRYSDDRSTAGWVNAFTGDAWYSGPGGSGSYAGAPGGRIDWVICGGESGHHARPMSLGWVEDICHECLCSRTPFFFKQWGEYHPRLRNGVWPDTRGGCCDHLPSIHLENPLVNMKRVGRARAGRLLDGREWNEFPEVV